MSELVVPFTHLRAVVFDWAGTTVDHGSLAPIRALMSAFSALGVELPMAEARDGMGLAKRDHIAHLLGSQAIEARFVEAHGRTPTDADVDAIFEAFVPLQTAILADASAVIDGVPGVVARLRERGLRIGSTTGYTRPMLDSLLAAAAAEGYSPDAAFCPDDVGEGRPSPLMLYANAVAMRVAPLASIVKVGDTPADIGEGRAAGSWSVGVAATGNEVGLDRDELAALDDVERERRVAVARSTLSTAGADAIIDDLGGLEAVLDELDARMARGERPSIA
jgi:phosphonoacetaldehyde hydrolase